MTVEGHFGPAQTIAQSGVDQSQLAECAHNDGRELVVTLTLTTTVTSSLPVKEVDVGRIGGYLSESKQFGFIGDFTEGPGCITEETHIELHTVQPHTPDNFTVWVILNEAITPNEPNPSPKRLGEGWRMWIPDVLVDGTLAGTTVQGSRVVNCGTAGEPFIFVAGDAPASYSPGVGRTPCVVQTKPVTAE